MQNRAIITELQISYHNKANMFKNIFIMQSQQTYNLFLFKYQGKITLFKKDNKGSYSCDTILQISVCLKMLIYR